MARSHFARLGWAGMTLVGMALAASAAQAEGGAAVCNGPECNGGGYGAGYGGAKGGFNEFWHRCGVDWHRNNSWPEPFLTADKAAVRTPYCIQIDNGWKMQNTLGTYLFDYETQRVNVAGDLLVKWIVTQAPHHRRAVFVLKGDSAEATNARVQSVQLAVNKHAAGCPIPVLLTDIEPPGWSAAYIDTITQQFNSTIPAPRLPARESSNSGGGGGGGGSGN